LEKKGQDIGASRGDGGGVCESKVGGQRAVKKWSKIRDFKQGKQWKARKKGKTQNSAATSWPMTETTNSGVVS